MRDHDAGLGLAEEPPVHRADSDLAVLRFVDFRAMFGAQHPPVHHGLTCRVLPGHVSPRETVVVANRVEVLPWGFVLIEGVAPVVAGQEVVCRDGGASVQQRRSPQWNQSGVGSFLGRPARRRHRPFGPSGGRSASALGWELPRWPRRLCLRRGRTTPSPPPVPRRRAGPSGREPMG